MPDVFAALLYTIFVWWFSTGIILFLNGLPRHTFKWTMSAATVILEIGRASCRERVLLGV